MELKQLKCANCGKEFLPKEGIIPCVIINSTLCSDACSQEGLEMATDIYEQLRMLIYNPKETEEYLRSLNDYAIDCITQYISIINDCIADEGPTIH